jgi:hypothetical protein
MVGAGGVDTVLVANDLRESKVSGVSGMRRVGRVEGFSRCR